MADILTKDNIIMINPGEVDARFDFVPGAILGLQSIIGTIWWFMIMLVYLKNSSNGANLTNLAGYEVAPIGWFWERATEINGKYVLLAWSLMLSWVAYFIVSVIEMFAWLFYLWDNYAFPRFWFSTIGYWGSIGGYFLGPLFALIYFGASLSGSPSSFPGTWTLFVFITGTVLWLVHGLLHIFFVPAFLNYIDAQPAKACECDILPVRPIAEDATDIELLAYKEDTVARAKLCIK